MNSGQPRRLSYIPVGARSPISDASSQASRVEEFMSVIRNKRKAAELLKFENEIYQQFVERNMTAPDASEMLYSEATPRHQTLRLRSKGILMERVRPLTIQQKCHVLFVEREILKSEMKAFMDKCEMTVQNYRAILATNAIRMDEIEKAKTELASIMPDGASCLKPVYKTESFLRYQNKTLTSRNNLIQSLRLKSSLLRGEIKQIKRNIQLTEIDDSRPGKIDFKVLQRANALFLATLQEKNNELVHAKKIGSTLGAKLRIRKEQLVKSMAENEKLVKLLESVQSQVLPNAKKINETLLHFEVDHTDRHRLLQLLENYRVPEVTSFIQSVINEQNLEKEQAIWNQRKHMAEAIYKHQRSLLSNQWNLKEKQAQTPYNT